MANERNQSEPQQDAGASGKPLGSSHWIPVGHDVQEHDLPPLKALAGAIIHSDQQKKRAGQEFTDEALSDAASFVEVGTSGYQAATQVSLAPIEHGLFAYISASAALYLLTHIHKEGAREEGRLKSALNLLDEYQKSRDSDVLHKAGLELEQVPDIKLNGETCSRTLRLLDVYEIGGRVANTDVPTAKKIADKLASVGHDAGHALTQTFRNAYWRNPMNVGQIFMSAVRAAAVSVRLAHLKITGSNEIRRDHKKGLWDDYRAQEGGPESQPFDLSEVVIEGMEEQNPEALDPKILEESLHIDAQYQELAKERLKFLQLAVIQGVFISASVAQGVYNGLKGDAGWSFINFSSASAASGPFKYFADTFVAKDALLRTHRAEMGHKIAALAGQSVGQKHPSRSKVQRDTHEDEGREADDAHHDRQGELPLDHPEP